MGEKVHVEYFMENGKFSRRKEEVEMRGEFLGWRVVWRGGGSIGFVIVEKNLCG